ncbi:MAG: MFS transporter [Alphaproteobacteria bacterium]|nr:MAG: MFS transporter [Alphaproteobacteria bacterium]
MAEMWERFSYYGMRALLILYLTKHFLFADGKAALIYGSYTALVYLLPVLGGALADRYLGSRKAVTYGAILLVLGHFGMAFEGPPAIVDGVEVVRSETHLQIFYLSLALIIGGVAFLKANMSTIVGALYAQGDPRREGGFSIYYMGINLGAFAAAIACGYLGETYGWRYGFGLAGIGMLFGLIFFLKGQHLLEGHAEPPDPEALKKPAFMGLSTEFLIYLSGIAIVVVSWQLVQHQEFVGSMLNGSGALVLAGILAYGIWKCDREERGRLYVATFLTISSILFWALFEQAGSSLNLLTDRAVDRELMGGVIPASVFQSLNSAFIFTLAPLFAVMWVWLNKRRLEPSTPLKFGIAMLLVGAGFYALVFGMQTSGAGKIAMIWIVALYFLHTCGELCLSPVGLSMITKLSPARIVGFMMGVWFLASAFANYVAGQIARMTSSETVGGEIVDMVAAKANYAAVYSQVGQYALIAGIVLIVLTPILKRFSHGIH